MKIVIESGKVWLYVIDLIILIVKGVRIKFVIVFKIVFIMLFIVVSRRKSVSLV